MAEKCKTCHKEFDSGIWLYPQFKDEGVLLFCSDKCKNKYIRIKLERIKVNYPKYYNKIIKSFGKKGFYDFNLKGGKNGAKNTIK